MPQSLNRNFIVLWHGQLVSQLGHQAFLIAATYYVLRATESATLVAMVLVSTTLPIVVLGAWAGALADRYDRRTIILIADAIRALTVAAVAYSLWQAADVSGWTALVIGVAAVNGAVQAFFAPALYAIIPDLVDESAVPSATALHQLSAQASVLTGQAFGGVLYAHYGAAAMFALNAVGFGYAALTAWLLPRQAAANKRGPAGVQVGSFALAREGLSYVRQRPGLLPLLCTFAGVNCLFMPVLVLLPFYVRDVLDRGPEWYGYVLGASAAGALAGSAGAASLLRRVPHRALLVRVCLIGIAVCVFTLAAARVANIAAITLGGVGLLASIINVTIVSSLQAGVAADMRGRVMALVVVLSGAATPLGMAFGGVAGDLWPDVLPLIFTTCGLLIVLLAVPVSRAQRFDAALDAAASWPPADHPKRGSGAPDGG